MGIESLLLMVNNVGLLGFLAITVVVSLSGVLAPGPVLTVTIAKGHKDKNAGAWVAAGHGIVEIPLILLIYLGFSNYLTSTLFLRAIGIIGGLLLVYMGISLIKVRGNPEYSERDVSYGPVLGGILATGSNPYFILWWATVGLTLISRAATFGFIGFAVFAVVHWLCDLAWDWFVSFSVFKSRKLWTRKVHAIVFSACGLLLCWFGVGFIIGGIRIL
jgi:threonine/homoserine/homoserine lactone efflux protein